ncbi:hypothetical protein F5Y03DRAFT_317360 [Xylaria venustula]|nr:hypothetical protein F5Y03DRAFT_317360 [Xylaria venustula]
MGTLRSRRFLRCFYCGQRSSIRFDGQTSFDCANCDATNWLDQHGEITDPPVATDSLNRGNVQYAFPRSPVPSLSPQPPSPSNAAPAGGAIESIFCADCLRNQHMLNCSLAQFEWPEEPTAADYRERERKYWSLKKELEKRYPQVCGKCLPKANAKLLQASYTAQTDHLRRMMDRTRSKRTEAKRRGPLDLVNFLGRTAWQAGYVLQGTWHLIVVILLLTESYASTPAKGGWIPAALAALHRLCATIVPSPDWTMQWAINLGLCAFPWNPRFKQSIRGFTAHILGFRQWYTYQLLALLQRFIALSIAQYSRSQGLPTTAQLGAQLIIPLLMIQLYLAAQRSIRTDTSPLFRQPAELTAGLHAASEGSSTASGSDMVGILDDILHSRDKKQGSSPGGSLATPFPPATNEAVQSPQEEPRSSHGPDEMEWSPSGSQHRAFSSYNSLHIKNTNPRFGDAPMEPKPGPLWYKVPPAPTNPAQRLRNPPMRPIIRESPKEKEPLFQSTKQQSIFEFKDRARESTTQLNLAAPKFHAPQPKEDPRDNLSSMFARSFSIGPEQDEDELTTLKSAKPDFHGRAIPNRTRERTGELVALVGALYGWVFALSSDSSEFYGRSVALASICVCLIVSIRLASDLEVDHQIRGGARPSVYTPSFANLALVQVLVVILLMWSIWSGSATSKLSRVYGNALFGGIIMHQMLHVFT